MPAWGPVTCHVGPGAVHAEDLACTLYDSGVLAGQVVRQVTGSVSWTWSGGRSDAAVAVRLITYDSTGRQIDNRQVVASRLSNNSATWSTLTDILTVRFVVEWHHAVYVGQSSTATASGTYDQTVYCAAGTQIKAPWGNSIYLTPELIATLAGSVSAGWLTAPLQVFAYTTLVVVNLCSGPPRQIPPITDLSTGLGIDYWRQVLEAIAWGYFCECAPSTPAPVPFPRPAPVQPPGFPVAPTFTCSETDICASIVEIRKDLAVVLQTLSSTYELSTLLQRYKAPFAYIKGARHSNLVQLGDFAVPRLVGVLVEVTARLGTEQSFTGNPPYVTDLGWLAVASPDGMLEEIRLTRDKQVWLPEHMTDATRFAYALRDDVVVAITELAAEP
jgi:hypothetical protein